MPSSRPVLDDSVLAPQAASTYHTVLACLGLPADLSASSNKAATIDPWSALFERTPLLPIPLDTVTPQTLEVQYEHAHDPLVR
jgi:hypothetical protein